MIEVIIFEEAMLLAPLRQEEPTGLDDLRSFGAEMLGRPVEEKPRMEIQ